MEKIFGRSSTQLMVCVQKVSVWRRNGLWREKPQRGSIDKGATISQDGTYRYNLWRRWNESLQEQVFVLLNPSTEDASFDDPTIRRCINIAKGLTYGGIYVVNVFAYRSTHPEDLLEAKDPVGPENRAYLQNAAKRSEKIICAWGGACSKKLRALNRSLDAVKKVLRLSAVNL